MNAGHGCERFDWARLNRPIVEDILTTALPMVTALDWTEDDPETLELDRTHGIDLIGRLKKHGQPLTFQIKCLSADNGYHTVTMEAENSFDGKPGDIQTCLSQFYFLCYSDGRCAERWCLLDLPRLHLASCTRGLMWRRADNTLSGANSKFRYLPFAELAELAPESVVMFGGDWQLGDAQVESRRVK